MTQSELDEINKSNVWKLVVPVEAPNGNAASDGSLDPLDGRIDELWRRITEAYHRVELLHEKRLAIDGEIDAAFSEWKDACKEMRQYKAEPDSPIDSSSATRETKL